MGNQALKGGGNVALDKLDDSGVSDIRDRRARSIFENFRRISVWKSSDGHARLRISLAFFKSLESPGPFWQETFARSRFVLEIVNGKEVEWCECEIIKNGEKTICWNGDSVSFVLCPRDEKSAELLIRVLRRVSSQVSQVKFVTVYFPGGEIKSEPIRHRFA